jgi:hypothetical protein
VLATNTQGESKAKRTINLTNIKEGMLPEEIIAAIGSPNHVSSESTGKKGVPFYFGTGTRRTSWSYTGAGYVVFFRNEYTGVLRAWWRRRWMRRRRRREVCFRPRLCENPAFAGAT